MELEEAGDEPRSAARYVAITALRRAAELSDRRAAAAACSPRPSSPSSSAGPNWPHRCCVRSTSTAAPSSTPSAVWIQEMIIIRPTSATPSGSRGSSVRPNGRVMQAIATCASSCWLAASRAWWTDPGPAARRILVDAARRLGGAGHPDPRVLATYACADPVNHAADALPQLRAMATRTLDASRRGTWGPRRSSSAPSTSRSACSGPLPTGRRGRWASAVLVRHVDAAPRGVDVAVPAGEEARRLATELGAPLWIAGGETVLSLVAGMRDDAEAAERGAAGAERLGLSAGGRVTVALAQFGRVLSALGESRHDDAYVTAVRLFDPADPAHHPVVAGWLIADLAEAALHTDRVAEATTLLARVEATAGAQPAVWTELNLRHARALLAPDDATAQRCLRRRARREPRTLALPPRAGSCSRTASRSSPTADRRFRGPLRTARDDFDTLGCLSWSERARRELRASGESSRRRDPAARDQLTAQELHIAQLAAQGLSNREIGSRLYVSHRTISTHLYRISPKLGITARSELAAALSVPTT